jgi:cell wall-associated NlpC family hydrolase
MGRTDRPGSGLMLALALLALALLAAPHAGRPLGRMLDTLPSLSLPAPSVRGAPGLPRPARPAAPAAPRQAAPAPAPAPAASRAVAFARGQLGKPYAWGAEGPGAFDCSGLTWAAWRAAGLDWPRMTAADQWHAFQDRQVPRGALRPGDLVFYANTSDWRSIHHVGLYAGAGRMIEAPYTGALVRTAPLDREGYFGAVRPGPLQGGGGR